MLAANILSVEKQGRHRYFKFANEEVAHVVESMASLIHKNKEHKQPIQNGLTYARTCYDHLAGLVGVRITNSLIENRIIEISDKTYKLTEHGEKWFSELGLNIDIIKQQNRSFAHQCLDWSERKHHIAGALGASLLEKMIANDWIRKKQNSKELIITSKAKIELKNRLNLELESGYIINKIYWNLESDY